MPFISARVISVVLPDTPENVADAGPNQSVLCAAIVTLQGNIVPGPVEDHTFEWEQTFGTPVTLLNPTTLTPSFVNPQISDIEFTFYVDRNTPFEDSDTVVISRRPQTSTFSGGGSISVQGLNGTAQIISQGQAGSGFTNEDAFVTGSAYAEPPVRYNPIFTAEDLDRIRRNPFGSYMLMNDIDISTDLSIPRTLRENWDPIGTAERPFRGVFDGNGYVIDNLAITDSVRDSGLFGTVDDTTIENLGIRNANITGQTSSFYSGILAGVVLAANATTIRNCYTTGDVDSEGDRAGGFVGTTGQNVGTLFENTYADVTVVGGGTSTGGWAGVFETEAQYTENYGNTTKTAAIVGSFGDTPIAGEVEGRTTAELNLEAQYTGWDFVNTWEIDEGNSPAALQNTPSDHIRVGGFCDDQWMIAWNNPDIIVVKAVQRVWEYKGVIAEERISGGWGFPRFIPHQRNSVLMTPNTSHRLSSVWLRTQKGLNDKEIIVINDEKFTSKNTSSRFGPYGNTALSAFGSSITSTGNLVITIQNPRKISASFEHDGFSAASARAEIGQAGITVSRFIQSLEEFEDIVGFSWSGLNGNTSKTVVITRANGTSIG
jgi:hypothetical protein